MSSKLLTHFSMPVPCSFEIYNFGPYSEDITRSANYLLADDALADLSSNPTKYSSYRVGPSADQISQEFRFHVAASRALIDSIVGVLAGSTPTDLELVATLHFVNAKLKGLSGSRPTMEEVVLKFKDIKGDKFTELNIATWYGWLGQSNLL